MKDLKWHLGQAINYYDCLWQDIFSLDGKGAWEFFQNWTVLTDFPLCIVTNAWHKAITVIGISSLESRVVKYGCCREEPILIPCWNSFFDLLFIAFCLCNYT